MNLFLKLDFKHLFQTLLLVLLVSSCATLDSYTVRKKDDLSVAWHVHHHNLQLKSDYSYNFLYSYPSHWLSFSYAPMYLFTHSIKNEPVKVRPQKTPWANAWDKSAVVGQMNTILLENGIGSQNVRVKMIAHAIVASGWKQHVWNYNAWGVKQGSWDKNFYMMPTQELDKQSNKVVTEDATWRSFDNWKEAILDFKNRIHAGSKRPSYRKAYAHLMDEQISAKAAVDYWEALGKGNYYTATKFTGKKFARLCTTVRSYL